MTPLARARTEARNNLLTALAEIGHPEQFHHVVAYALGTDGWDRNRALVTLYDQAMQSLVRRRLVIQEQPAGQEWRVLYRLATDADRDAVEDLEEVRRMMGTWSTEP